jgi:hypothetical protein
MCQRAIRAVRAVLEEEPYRSRLSFEVIGWETERGLRAQKDHCFGADRHGLVVLDAEGRSLACRAGHSYGEAEIRESFDRALSR